MSEKKKVLPPGGEQLEIFPRITRSGRRRELRPQYDDELVEDGAPEVEEDYHATDL